MKSTLRSNRFLEIYRILYKFYGPQGWWPVTSQGGLEPKYRYLRYRTKNARDQFEICLGAILTQNTSWRNVEKALSKLHAGGIFSPESLIKAGRRRLEGMIRSSGYYKQKAARLIGFFSGIEKFYGGDISKLLSKPVAMLRTELLAVKGIGPETCDSIILYAANKPKFVVDSYTRRIFKRLGLVKSDDYHKVQSTFEEDLGLSVRLFNEYHALIVRHAKQVCKTKPQCGLCVLKSKCKICL